MKSYVMSVVKKSLALDVNKSKTKYGQLIYTNYLVLLLNVVFALLFIFGAFLSCNLPTTPQ